MLLPFEVNVVRLEATMDITIHYMDGQTEVGTDTVTLEKGAPERTIQPENLPEGYELSPADQSATAEYTADGKVKINGSVVSAATASITFTVKKAARRRRITTLLSMARKPLRWALGKALPLPCSGRSIRRPISMGAGIRSRSTVWSW